MDEPCLQWVIVNGEIRHVSDFANLPLDKRPDAFCPLCKGMVILKLGKERAHHAAHYEGNICDAIKPETAIHINSKYHLWQMLSATNKLKIWQYCEGRKIGPYKIECANKSKRGFIFLEDWDRVEVEFLYGGYRLDVALLSGEKIIGAIEILVTHPTEEGKIEFLNKQGIMWVEIRVTKDFYSPPTEWKAETPLDAEKCNRSSIDFWQCDNCIAIVKGNKKREEEQRRLIEEKQRKLEYAKQFETFFLRVVDFYYPSGKKYRSIYIIQTKLQKDRVIYAELQEVGAQRRSIKIVPPPISDFSFKALKDVLKNELRDKKQNKDWIIDDSRDWIKTPIKFRIDIYKNSNEYPFKFEWKNNQWKEAEHESSSSSNFEPHYFIQKESAKIKESLETSKTENSLSLLTGEYPCEKCGRITSDWVQFLGATKTCICRECANKK